MSRIPVELWLVLVIGAAVAWWWQATGALEQARRAGREACRRAGVQFLDDSVVRTGTRPVWKRGGLRLARRYAFEFATRGDRRYSGWVCTLGQRVTRVHMEPHVVPEEAPVNQADRQ